MGNPAWSREDFESFAAALPMFEKCKVVKIQQRGVDEDDVQLLLNAFKRMSNLEKVDLSENLLSEERQTEIQAEINTERERLAKEKAKKKELMDERLEAFK